MRYPLYPVYKASGIEWLGEVPEHWEVDRLKWSVSQLVNGIWGEEPDGENDVVCVRVADFDRSAFRVVEEPPTVRSITRSERRGRLLQKGDLLLEKSGGGEKQLVGCVVLFDRDFEAVTSNFIGRMPVAREMNARFWAYCHAALYSGKLSYPAIKQTTGIQNLDSQAYLDTKVAYPPLEEQRAIAAFLDAATAKIDALIEKKQALIELLKEKRDALISRTVTRGLPVEAAAAAGLDPQPRLKPSGVEWLGDIPEHWEAMALKWESPVLRGASPRPIDDPIYFDDEGRYAWVRISDVTSAGMYLARTVQRLSDLGSSLSVKLGSGSIFLSIAGSVGKPCITKIDCCIHDGFVYFPLWRGDARFLYYLFECGEPYKGLGKMGTQLNLNTDTVGSIHIGVPPVAEQRIIGNYLDRATASTDLKVSRIEAAIDCLQEYRSALITAAVTGKIDVRQFAS